MKTLKLAALFTVAVLMVGASADAKTLVLCYPGGTVKERDAKPATEQMLRVMEKMAGWPTGDFKAEFTSDMSKCDQLMASNPEFAIVSLGYMLSHEDSLMAVVQPKMAGKTTETFRVLVRKGAFASMDALKGKKLTGTPLAEPAFIEKIVFAGKYPLATFEVVPCKGALKSLRELSEGKVDSVVVTDQQWSSLKSSPMARDFDVVFTSKPQPIMPLVASRSGTTIEERKTFTSTMQKFCSNREGKQFCELFGIDSFTKANDKDYNEARTLWK